MNYLLINYINTTFVPTEKEDTQNKNLMRRNKTGMIIRSKYNTYTTSITHTQTTTLVRQAPLTLILQASPSPSPSLLHYILVCADHTKQAKPGHSKAV